MNISINEMSLELKKHDEYRIFYHKDPDGDAIGSAYALAIALQLCGKKCDIRANNSAPEVYSYLTDRFIPDTLTDPVCIAVDSANLCRLGVYSTENIFISIDHHEPNTIDAQYSYTDPEAAACCEIIFDLIECLNVHITPLIADFLYTGIATDTYCFRSYVISQKTFEICAKLASFGANIVGISRRHFMTKTRERMMIEKYFADSFQYFYDGKILCGTVTLEDMKKANIDNSELEGLNSVTERVSGVLIGVTIRECAGGKCRISVHTNEGINASDICAKLGGGGHSDAAGCEFKGTPQQASDIIKDLCIQAIDNR